MSDLTNYSNINLNSSSNIFEDIMKPIETRNQFKLEPSPQIPIYFYRLIGTDLSGASYYAKLKSLDSKLLSLGPRYIRFENKIDFKMDNNIIAKLQPIWSQISSTNKSDIDKVVNHIKNSNIFILIQNSTALNTLYKSLTFTLELFSSFPGNNNVTKLKNFTIKLLIWINQYAKRPLSLYYPLKHEENINPKILYYGDIKKHECLFLIFLSKLGFDVLYINPQSDSCFAEVDGSERFSKLDVKTDRISLQAFPKALKPTTVETEVKKTTVNVQRPLKQNNVIHSKIDVTRPLKVTSKNLVSDLDIYHVKLKKFSNDEDIFRDFLAPLNERAGYLGAPSNIFPSFFHRCIGINESDTKYRNSLFRLNKKLSNLGMLYKFFEGKIPVVSNPSLFKDSETVWHSFGDFSVDKKDLLVNLLMHKKLFPSTGDKLKDNSIVKAFSDTILLFLENNSNINSSIFKNFVLKLLTWSHEFMLPLFRSFHYDKKNKIKVPKVLYYGDIKAHEVYFLIWLHFSGADVLYINTHSNSGFSEVKGSEVVSTQTTYEILEKTKSFPKEEILERFETVAYQASNELSQVIYTEDVGLFKPWQFEEYDTKPITLKTTFDELLILWNEESRMRTNFKIENRTVYIPNLFAKISGVKKDIDEYWSNVKTLKENSKTIFIDKIPFTRREYTKQDLYAAAYIVKDSGEIDRSKLYSSRFYKFAYLKTPLQEKIISTMEYMYKAPLFKSRVDKEFRLRILMDVLTMRKDILESIQRFDYPFDVPKLLIYDNAETVFSKDDAIIMCFLYLMGFDIVILTPTGYNNIENLVSDSVYDTHKLEDINLSLPLPDFNRLKTEKPKSFWGKLFS